MLCDRVNASGQETVAVGSGFGREAGVPETQDELADQLTEVPVLQVFKEPTPGLEPGTPSLRGKDE